MVGPKLVLVIVIVGALLVGGVVTPPNQYSPNAGNEDASQNRTGIIDTNSTLNLSVPEINITTPGPAVQQGYNRTLVERYFIEYLNEERSNRSLQTVSKRDVLTQMAKNHSVNMARHSYLGHTEPDGTSPEDRYDSRGLLPECRLPIQGSDAYYPGAENAAYNHVDSRVRVSWADGGTFYVSDEEDLAYVIFQGWMHSSGHRKAMLVASSDEAGLGLYITEEDRVYATLNLC